MNQAPHSILRRIFVSNGGIRAGWSLAIFLTLYSILTLGAQFAFASVPPLRAWAAAQPRGVITPVGQIAYTGLELLILLICVTLVSRVEGRCLQDYGLSPAKTMGEYLLMGLAFGFGMASALTGLIAIFGGYSVYGLAISGSEIALNAFLYGIGFFIVAFFEEFAFRGEPADYAATGYWILARSRSSFTGVRSRSLTEPGKSMDRRSAGRLFWPRRCLIPEAYRQSLVHHRRPCCIRLGQHVLLFLSDHWFIGARPFDECDSSWA